MVVVHGIVDLDNLNVDVAEGSKTNVFEVGRDMDLDADRDIIPNSIIN